MNTPGHLVWGTTFLRLIAGTMFGAVVGFEREADGHDAGVRTHALLALGAALFGAISVGALGGLVGGRNTNITIDPTRIASYVAAGIGFLGAGAIIKGPDHIKGLTTAASLWAVAAVGLASGMGFWSGAVAGTAIATLALIADRPLRWLLLRLKSAPPPPPGSDGSGRGSHETEARS